MTKLDPMKHDGEEDFIEVFWQAEMKYGYYAALTMTCADFGISLEEGERLLIEDDMDDDGNC